MAGAAVLGIVGFAAWHVANSSPLAGFASAPAATPPAVLITDASPIAQAPSAAPDVVVYVCGNVHKPGVYHLTSGLRVADAITKAGGASADADLEQLNLAQVLSDAMKIVVPKKGQLLAFDVTAAPADAYGVSHQRSGRHGGRSSHKLQPGQTLDVNTATESELTQLPGVGPGLARRIIEYRTANGPFQTVDDLQNVSGIGPSKFDRMAAYVRL